MGFSTLSVSSSPKEAIDYIKGSMLAGVTYDLATPLKEVAWRNLLPFMEFKQNNFSDNSKKLTNFSANVKVSRKTLAKSEHVKISI